MGLAKAAGRAGRAGKSVELCNKGVAQSHSHGGRLAVQGRAKFGTRSEVPTTRMLSWVAWGPIRIPSRETTPALPGSEKPSELFSVCLSGDGDSFDTGKILNPKDTHLWSRRILVQCLWTAVPSIHSFASSLGSDFC